MSIAANKNNGKLNLSPVLNTVEKNGPRKIIMVLFIVYAIGGPVINKVTNAKKKYFQAAKPYEFNSYLEKKEEILIKQKEKLKQIIPSLVSISNLKEEKLEAEIFTGYDGLKSAFIKLIENYDSGGKYLFFYNNDNMYKDRVDDFFLQMKVLLKPDLEYKGLADKSYKSSRFLAETKKHNLKNFKIKFVDFPIIGNIDICNNKVLIVSWGKNPTGFLIHSKDIADSISRYFEFVWKISK